MRVVVVSDDKKVFSSFKKGKDVQLTFLAVAEFLEGALLEDYSLVYLDIHSLGDTWRNTAQKLSKNENLRVALIDPKQQLGDPGAEFHLGMVDYLNPGLLVDGIPAKRYRNALQLNPLPVESLVLGQKAGAPLSGDSWEGIKENKEYKFGLLFIEMDDAQKLKNTLGGVGSAAFSQEFQQFLVNYFGEWDGYLWIPTEFGGLLLFPFDGKRMYPLQSALELTLNADLIQFRCLKQRATMRMVVHIGDTIYKKRGETGEMVCDTLNSIFHLGVRGVEKGSLLITEEVYPLVPDSLKAFFHDKGSFEGRKIYGLKDRF